MNTGTAYAKARVYWIGRGKTGGLRIHPRTKVRMALSASFDIDGSFRLGFCGNYARYSPSFARFGKDSRTTVSGDFTIFSDFSLVVDDGAELGDGRSSPRAR
jgi:hypothetical protein